VEQKPVETRRDRRIQRKREEILAAATRVFAQKGFINATNKDIADEADMGESTLYNYFDSKRDILLAIVDETDTLVGTIFDQAFGEPLDQVDGVISREALVDLIDRYLALFISRLEVTRTFLMEAWIDDNILKSYVWTRIGQVHRLLIAFITDRMEAGAVRTIDPEVAARFALGWAAG